MGNHQSGSTDYDLLVRIRFRYTPARAGGGCPVSGLDVCRHSRLVLYQPSSDEIGEIDSYKNQNAREDEFSNECHSELCDFCPALPAFGLIGNWGHHPSIHGIPDFDLLFAAADLYDWLADVPIQSVADHVNVDDHYTRCPNGTSVGNADAFIPIADFMATDVSADICAAVYDAESVLLYN